MSFLIISMILVIIDQWSKWIAVTQLKGAASISVIGDLLRFTYVENRGAAFGILQDQRLFFLVITVIVIAFLVRLLWKNTMKSAVSKTGISFIIAGAIGNLIDRMLHGFVVDFIQVDLVKWFDFPVFNVADIGVTVGVGLVIIGILFLEEEEVLS